MFKIDRVSYLLLNLTILAPPESLALAARIEIY